MRLEAHLEDLRFAMLQDQHYHNHTRNSLTNHINQTFDFALNLHPILH